MIRMGGWRCRVLAVIAVAILGGGSLEGMGLAGTPLLGEGAAGSALAWFRVERTTREAQEYRDTPYIWLGRTAIRLEVDTVPAPGHVLELSWGAKGDMREAVATVNGREMVLRQGGYDGFKPLRIDLPGDLAGSTYEILLVPGGEKAAFIGSFRLLGAGGVGAAEEAAQASHSMRLEPVRAPRPEAFPDMRKLWDREPPPPEKALPGDLEASFRQAERNARLASEALYRSRKFIDGWLAHSDPRTGLIPRNLTDGRDIWNAQDAAADNYPFMVLTAAITDRPLFEGRMLQMLRTETGLTCRIDRLPDTWSFSKGAFQSPELNLDAVIFGGSEYVKDGLLPLTEWLGPSPWSERMLGIVEDLWKHAPVETQFGRIPSTNVEVNGEMLQALSRLFWFAGNKRYLEYAVRLGDYYLLGSHHPTRDFTSLRLRDHGCEVVSGLSELYAAVAFAAPQKKKEYEGPIHAMFDRILEVGRDDRGMLYNAINPKTGAHDPGICDTWGYNYNGVYAVYLLDGTASYREAVVKVLSNLKEHLTEYDWGSADEYADSVEGAINLLNREHVPSAAEWVETEIRDMWSIQKPDGVIEGWHGDGNSARTSIMFALWKSQGLTVRPWRKDVRVGAVRAGGSEGDGIHVSLLADEPWEGRLLFDRPRHREVLHLPLAYPRINQFPEWFVAEEGKRYAVRDPAAGTAETHAGADLRGGLPVRLEPGKELRLTVAPLAP